MTFSPDYTGFVDQQDKFYQMLELTVSNNFNNLTSLARLVT